MKVLFVTPYFYPKTGGLENYVYNIAKGLIDKYKWKVVVITSNHKSYTNTQEKIGSITVYRLAPLFKISNTPLNPFWLFTMKKIIDQEKPDIINGHAPVPFIADIALKLKGKIPYVLTYHAGSMKKSSFLYDVIISIYENFFLRNLFKNSTSIICSSNFVKSSIPQAFQEKCVVITPAVDTKVFKPNAKQKKKYDVLFVGRYRNVYRLKGFFYLLDAIKQLPEITLTVVGEKVPTMVKNVQFLGIKTSKQLAEILQQSKLLVLPSIAPMESFGMVLIEAMAAKLPVIGTQMGGIPEVIKNKKNGFLVVTKSSSALKRAIQKILFNKILLNKMGKESLILVKTNFTWQNKLQLTHRIFKENL